MDYLTQPPNKVRRSDREVNDEGWIKALLTEAPVGSLATVHGDQPFINSNLFVYDEAEHAIYIHTARKGRTRANIEESAEKAQKVCFSVFTMGRLLPAAEALEFSVEYSGVVVFGTASVIENNEPEEIRMLQQLLDKYAPHLTAGVDYRPPVPEELSRTTVMKISIESWSGKQKKVGAFEGAYFYEDVRQTTELSN